MSEISVYECKEISVPVQPSGNLERRPWDTIKWIREFHFLGSDRRLPVDRFFEAAACWNEQLLHVAFRSASSLVPVTEKDRDQDIFNECAAELFLAAGSGYYEIEINPLGAVLDLYFPDEGAGYDWRKQAKWNAKGMSWAVGKLPGGQGWTAELSIPWVDLPLLNREEWQGRPCIRANFCRSQRRPDGTFELPAWGPVQKKFGELAPMGRLIL